MKKIVSLLLVILIALSCCSFGMAEEDRTLNVRWRYHSLMNNITEADGTYYDNRIVNAHNEQSGITVNWEYALQNGAEETQKQTLMLASGNELPDIMSVSYVNYQSWAPQGLFVETTDAMANMPDYTKLIPQAAIDYVTIDGHTYCFPSSQEEAEMAYGGSICVRYDLFKTLGIEKDPQTTEEYYQMWLKVKELYPDMIPLSGDLAPLQAAFGVYNSTVLTDDGLVFNFTLPEYKEYVEFVRKLYAEGILDQEFGTSSTTTKEEKVISERLYSLGGGWATIISVFNQKPENLTTDQFKHLPQMTRDAETPAVMGSPVPVQLISAVPTKKSDKFDLACEWINYMASDAGKKVQDYGIEGVDYTVDANGDVVQSLDEQNAVGWKICYEVLATAPSFYVRLYAKGFDWSFNGMLDSREASNVVDVPDYVNFMPTNEEYVELKQELGVETYASEQTTLFIIGQRDMSEWDAFQSELENRGLSELTEKLNEWYKMYN